MSLASVSRNIKFLSKAGSYNAFITSSVGDLFQEWDGTENDVRDISPNYEQLQPKLMFVATSSRVAEGIVTPIGMRYYFNGTEITFSGDTSTDTFAGYFRKISPAGDNPYYGLQILKDIVQLSGFAPAIIKMEADVAYGTQRDTLQATYAIQIQKKTGSSYRVTIAAGDSKNFVLRSNTDSCILRAMAYQNAHELTNELSYRWEKMGAANWEVLEGQTGRTLTVSANDISTFGEYRVTVIRGGMELGKDIQAVVDASDPLDIDPHPNPEDETISEDLNGNGSVTYTPVLVSRNTRAKVKDILFHFFIHDAAGTPLNTDADRTTAKASATVTRDMCIQAGGDVSIVITTAEE